MPISRHIVALLCCALVLGGCAARDFPDIAPNFSAESRDAAWPGFLPVSLVLSGDATDFQKSALERRAFGNRILQLKRRARLLRAPVLGTAERIRMQRAADQRRL